MVAYAETSACRRRLLLDHFGDRAAAEAPRCCDNCLARAAAADGESRRAETRAEFAALIALDTVRRLPWEVGAGKVAQILKGSRAQDVARYQHERHFGKLAELPSAEVESLVGQLIRLGHLKQLGGRLPVVTLTPRGEAALAARAAIPVSLRLPAARPQRPPASRSQVEDTVEQTARLFADGLPPERIAAERGLAVRTIYAHLAELIGAGRLSPDAVVPPAARQAIRQAILRVGAVDRLAPLKSILPPSINYDLICCEVAAWQREQELASAPVDGQAPPPARSPAAQVPSTRPSHAP